MVSKAEIDKLTFNYAPLSGELTTTPKSGDVELHTAPRLAAANIAITASEQFGI